MKKNSTSYTIVGLLLLAAGVAGYFILGKKDAPTASTPAVPSRESAIQNRIAEIKKDANYMDAVKKDAAKKGITLNEALIQSATYSVDYLTGY